MISLVIVSSAVILGHWLVDGVRKSKAKIVIRNYENGVDNDQVAYLIAKRIINNEI